MSLIEVSFDNKKTPSEIASLVQSLVPRTGLEPVQPKRPLAPQASVSTNSTTSAGGSSTAKKMILASLRLVKVCRVDVSSVDVSICCVVRWVVLAAAQLESSYWH